MLDDSSDETERRASAYRLAMQMARRLALVVQREAELQVDRSAEDEALKRFCRLTDEQITLLRAVPFGFEERALQVAGRAVALLMNGDVPWIACDGDVQSAVMPDDEAGAQQANVATALGGIVASELIGGASMPVAAVQGRTQLRCLELYPPALEKPAAVFECFRRYYAEQFLPHVAAITVLANELQLDEYTPDAFAQFALRWNLFPRRMAIAA